MPELSSSGLLINCAAGNQRAAMCMKSSRAPGASVSGEKLAVPFIFSVLLVLSAAFALGWPPKRRFG